MPTTLVDKPKKAGTYTSVWNANNLPSGVYFYRAEMVPVPGSREDFPYENSNNILSSFDSVSCF